MNTSRDLFSELVRTNFKLKYSGSVLGFIWVLIKPFLIFLVLFIVFSGMSTGSGGLSSRGYAAYLLLGLIIFNFFSEGVTNGMNALLDKENIILKINFNRVIAVLSSIAMAVINFLIAITIALIFTFAVGSEVTLLSGVYFLFICVTVLVMIFSISLFTSVLLIRLRDLTHITELGLQILFYGSAVFYPISFIPARWRFIVEYNPIAILIDGSRSALVYGILDHQKFIFTIFAGSVLLGILGWFYFKRQIKQIAEFF